MNLLEWPKKFLIRALPTPAYPAHFAPLNPRSPSL